MKPAEIRWKKEKDEGNEDWIVTVDGRDYTTEAIAGFVRFGLKYQYGLLDDILKERGLIAVDTKLVNGSWETDLGDGWSMLRGQEQNLMKLFVGLRIPFLMLPSEENETRRILREKIGRLGDTIMEMARIERSADTSGARRGKETG